MKLALVTLLLASASTASAETAINFFGDVDYNVNGGDDGTTNSFQASTLDIFATQREGKFGFIGEIVGEAFGTNEFEIDIDRLEASYQARPWLRFRAGRLRTAWGYYGDAYQNGKFFMVPVVWPEAYESFREDGVLPTHSVGAHVDVAKKLGDSAKVTLDAEVFNGRARKLDGVNAFADDNAGKAFNLRLRYVGQGKLDGLVVGGNLYVDQIPNDPEIGRAAMHELIVGVHAAYIAHRVHAIAEYARMRHRENGTEMVHASSTAFGELGYAVSENWTPYTRYEWLKLAKTDMYFADLASADLDSRLSVGVKYTASASVAFKLEGSVSGVTDRDFLGIAQAAFAF